MSHSSEPDETASTAARLERLERQVTELSAQFAELRGQRGPAASRGDAPRHIDSRLADALRLPVRPQGKSAFAMFTRPVLSGLELESLVGRYGTLALAGLLVMMAVGAIIKLAVTRGWLTPEVRLGFGAMVAAGVAGAGLFFRARGERRYGNVLLALALAIVDLLAWGAGPRFHLMPTSAALAIVDVVAVGLAMLALHDDSEFLFSMSLAAALSAPFVTADDSGTAARLLGYGAVVLLGGLRAERDPRWLRALFVLVVGALGYALAAASMPLVDAWYAPYLIVGFGGGCALGALLLGEPTWRADLARAYLAVGLVGVPVGWDRMVAGSPSATVGIGAALALVTYWALWSSPVGAPLWSGSALALPLLSLGVASAGASGNLGHGAVLAAWSVLAFLAWWSERGRGNGVRGGVHFMAGGILGSIAIATLLWSTPLGVVGGLAAFGALLALLCREEATTLPLGAVGVALGVAVLSAMDQLASRGDYSYTPFLTRSSGSALVATAGIGLAGWLLNRGRGAPAEWASPAVRLGSLVAFAVAWGRMEMAGAFSQDMAAFLLVSYYAACGVASIVAGQRLEVRLLRVAGLGLAVYAAVKAAVEATNIEGIALRVGAYGAVGVFMLGAGYLYRDRGEGVVELGTPLAGEPVREQARDWAGGG